jgi:hypothetical protein
MSDQRSITKHSKHVICKNGVHSNYQVGYPCCPNGFSPPPRHEVELAKEFLLDVSQSARISPMSPTNFGLRVFCEKECGQFVCPGAVIAAAVELGIPAEACLHGPGAFIALSIDQLFFTYLYHSAEKRFS